MQEVWKYPSILFFLKASLTGTPRIRIIGEKTYTYMFMYSPKTIQNCVKVMSTIVLAPEVVTVLIYWLDYFVLSVYTVATTCHNMT